MFSHALHSMRRTAVPIAITGLLLTACAPGDTGDDQGGSVPSTAASAEASTRTFVDITGESIEVPADPQRIVAIHDVNAGEQILSLGFELVGMATRDGEFDGEVAAVYELDGVEPVGDVYTPNVEAILALDPDLIVGEGYNGAGQDQFMEEGLQDQLEAIAPVVYIDTFRPVDDVMTEFAGLLGPSAEDEVARQRDEYQAAIAEVSDELGDPNGLTAAVVGMRADDVVEAYGPETQVPSVILTQLGIEQPDIVAEAEEAGGYLSISLERIPELSADVILLDTGVGEFGGDYTGNALWQALPAVQAGQVYRWGAEWYGTTFHRFALALSEMGLALTAADRDVVE